MAAQLVARELTRALMRRLEGRPKHRTTRPTRGGIASPCPPPALGEESSGGVAQESLALCRPRLPPLLRVWPWSFYHRLAPPLTSAPLARFLPVARSSLFIMLPPGHCGDLFPMFLEFLFLAIARFCSQ